MPVVVIGVDHRATSQDVLACTTVNGDALDGVLERLGKSDHITEAVVLSTCLRTELYVDAVRFHGAVRDARNLIAELAGENLEDLDVFELYDDTAYAHLFRVACGLESSVVGEPEVLGQVARAWEAARQAGSSRSVLNALFKRTVEVGKRARTETAIARGTTSIGQAAVEMVRTSVGDLTDKRVLIVGAGEMGDSMAVALADTKHKVEVKVTNRTAERASELADRVAGAAEPFENLAALVSQADIVLSSTGAKEPVITGEMVRSAMASRTERPVVFVDVAMPADVEIDVRDIEAVTVLDMTDLNTFAGAGRQERKAAVIDVEMLIDEEVQRYVNDVNVRTVVPVLAALREKVEAVRDLELERQGKKLMDLDPSSRATVDSIINAVVAKLLHEPTVRLKASAGTPEAERLAESIRYLFDI